MSRKKILMLFQMEDLQHCDKMLHDWLNFTKKYYNVIYGRPNVKSYQVILHATVLAWQIQSVHVCAVLNLALAFVFDCNTQQNVLNADVVEI